MHKIYLRQALMHACGFSRVLRHSNSNNTTPCILNPWLRKHNGRWPRRAMTACIKHSPFFLPLHSFFPLQNYTRRVFFSELHATFFQCNNYTRRFFNAIIYLHATFAPKITLAVFLELRC
jgi:hypothetical protein